MPGRLEGKVAVVTGGASGIGRETVRRFAEEGSRVCVADLADEPGKETASEVDGIYVHADVTVPDDVQRMYTETAEHFGGIDVLFNNAGISPSDDDSILETGLEAWERVQSVNLKSVYLCCKYGIPYLLERGGGSIINTGGYPSAGILRSRVK
jgi:NAD(P)-dependent dehydrogenase (short-subunit alcohol dehydrogenase family)